ncbi:nitrilase 1 [Cavenderia fasciculata]|uniref:Nitrilase 1 n=1 Tax=Cavenderia fasciculata TaxID=261658 RepID=F4QBZ1_CACFS|nr:nitrilase 1 [Cavenderia fasciculata]EGG14729.1 nitrilase 1 [Cavenderia fasciculata]|eukprot:XP_004351237.1 nitrilase 1 [Cavenderia fasciculata]
MENGNQQQQQQPFKIAVGQIKSVNNKDINFSKCQEFAEESVKQGAFMLCLPECFAFMSGGGNPRESIENAEPLDGPTINRYRQLARDNRLWLSLGGFHEKVGSQQPTTTESTTSSSSSDTSMIYNSHLIIDDNGDIKSIYHKMHLFDVNIPSKNVHFNESKAVVPGKEIMVCDSPGGRLGLSVCYDVRFPQLYIKLRSMGSQILLVPAAFMQKTGEAHWHTLLKSRAIENQCYVVAAAQTGQHYASRTSYGHSLVVDPWGTVLVDMEDKEGVGIATIDHNLLNQVRENMPCFTHIKSDY